MNNELIRLHELLNQSLALLDKAAALVEPAGVEPRKETVKMLGRAVGEILHARKGIYDIDPSLKAPGS
jgi:hypothetical protein